MSVPTTFDHPPAELLAGAFGWNYESEPDPADAGRWRPRAWRIFYPTHKSAPGGDETREAPQSVDEWRHLYCTVTA